MALVAVGIHERNAPLELFEKVAVSETDLPKVIAQLTDSPQISEAVVLSTCLRTEVYAVVERFHDGLADLEGWLRGRAGGEHLEGHPPASNRRMPEPGGGVLQLGGPFVCWYDDAAIAHLLEVAAGIDSPVLGEGEVLGQVRRAADAARAERAAGPVLVPLFRHAVEAGKRARHETRIQRGTTSLAHAVVELAADHSLGLEGKDILLVGAGEMGTGIARALAGRADLTGDVVVANRGPERAMAAADLVAGRAVGFDDLPEVIQEADVILTSTAAGDAILSPERLSPVLAKRAATSRGRTPRPLVIVDAAVPRDIDPAVGQLDGVLLLDLEDVRRHAEEQMERREQEIPAVRAILAEELERYRTVARGRMADPVVSALRARGELLRERELERYRTRIEALDPAGRELVDAVTKRLVAKLLHEPTVRLKDAAGSPRGERLAEAVRVLFDL